MRYFGDMIDMNIELRKITLPVVGIDQLVADAKCDDHPFVQRLVDEWASGKNRFSTPGELFLGAYNMEQLVGIGGLNHCPYSDDATIGRLRHIYVLKVFRGNGIAGSLIDALMDSARNVFQLIRLRTVNVAAARLYEAHHFVVSADPNASHEKVITRKLRP